MEERQDLISRQAAIDATDRADYRGLTVEDVKKVTDEVVKELKQLPSAQRKILKYTGDSICLSCQTINCDGCMYEPMKGVQ